jgi:hypothetical protein
MQNSINVTGSPSRAINLVLGTLEQDQRGQSRPGGTSAWLAGELAQEARIENLAWLGLAVAGLTGLLIGVWI